MLTLKAEEIVPLLGLVVHELVHVLTLIAEESMPVSGIDSL